MTNTVIATWPFSSDGVRAAASALKAGRGALDAVETGISVVEHDATVTSVGYGGLPTREGKLELDAALMSSTGGMGAVLGVRGFRSAIPCARLVFDKSEHSMFCDRGAVSFCKSHGLTPTPKSEEHRLLTTHAQKRFEEFQKHRKHDDDDDKDNEAFVNVDQQQKRSEQNQMGHTDTVGMLVCSNQGTDIVAGCATSGMQFKHAGRVGDAPVFGAGLYAAEAGAASASGDGDRMLKYCLSFAAVELIRAGASPSIAAQDVVRRVALNEATCQAAVIAMDKDGNVGASATHDGFTAMTWSEDEGYRELKPHGVLSKAWKHSCV